MFVCVSGGRRLTGLTVNLLLLLVYGMCVRDEGYGGLLALLLCSRMGNLFFAVNALRHAKKSTEVMDLSK